jgi:DNA repair protein RecN (Recombination protein N)
MLSQLTIRDFAIVDHLEIDWLPGLNVITGETGAGKSILIDAVGALLGDRLTPDVIRAGAARALVEGVFTVTEESSLLPELKNTLDEYGLDPEDGALIVSREIAGGGGRGRARVNGRSVPLSVLRELGERLVDIHGQSEHMALLRGREQLDYLDRYAGALVERSEVARLFRERRVVSAAYEELLASEREMARLQDMLRHEVTEIEGAGLREDEEATLAVQRDRLQHVEHLRQAAGAAVEALSGDGDERGGAIDLLGQAIAGCLDGGRIDPALAAHAETLQAAFDQVEESARELRDYLESMEADPQELERTAERLFFIGDLKRKYGDSVAEIQAYAAEARGRLGEIDRRSDRLEALRARGRELEQMLATAAEALSARRLAAARTFADAVQHELDDLRLADARFDVDLERIPVDSTGIDRVEFTLSRNDERRSMAHVASGGELARIALAVKTVLTRAETRPTLIFDEVDVGVGGRTAPVVGQKLAAVAAAGHQVLCVTHMPQVAAFADGHYTVSRSGSGVSVMRLEPEQRPDELAAMLSGTQTEASRRAARELLQRARS